MLLAHVGARTDSTTCYSYSATCGQFPRMRIGIDSMQDIQYVPRVLHFSALHYLTAVHNVVIPVLSPCFLYHPYIPHFLIQKFFIYLYCMYVTRVSLLSQCFIQTFYLWGGGGQTRVLEILRRGSINHQAVLHNKVKIQGGHLGSK